MDLSGLLLARYASSRCVPELAEELVKSGVEIIVAQGAAVSRIAKLSLPIPIVYIFSGDPTAAGFASSLSRPNENMTGVTLMAAELNGKRLEILRDIVPGLRRVAIIANPEHDGVNLERANSEETGQRLGIDIRYYPTASFAQLEAVRGERDLKAMLAELGFIFPIGSGQNEGGSELAGIHDETFQGQLSEPFVFRCIQCRSRVLGHSDGFVSPELATVGQLHATFSLTPPPSSRWPRSISSGSESSPAASTATPWRP